MREKNVLVYGASERAQLRYIRICKKKEIKTNKRHSPMAIADLSADFMICNRIALISLQLICLHGSKCSANKSKIAAATARKKWVMLRQAYITSDNIITLNKCLNKILASSWKLLHWFLYHIDGTCVPHVWVCVRLYVIYWYGYCESYEKREKKKRKEKRKTNKPINK